jgi:L-rhamnonate dehydratase
MKITEIKLYTIRAGNLGERGADVGESQYWGGGWATQSRIANPMSVHPAYAATRTLWMGAGQDPYAIEIYTDEGVTGVAANYGGGPFSCAVIQKHLSRFLIGADPFNIELLWDQMYRVTAPYGLGAITSMAISGVDLALWDLMGKALGQPVYRLLGGRTKASIPLYVTVHPDQAACWKDRGFMGIKIAAPWGIADGRSGLRKMEKCVADTRLAIGDDLDLMIDCYMSWGFEFTIKMAERVRDFDVLWFEDPLPNGYVDKMYSNLRPRISPVLIANGNMEFNYKAFESLMVAGATDVIQPEMQWCGGGRASDCRGSQGSRYSGDSSRSGRIQLPLRALEHQLAICGVPGCWRWNGIATCFRFTDRRAAAGKWTCGCVGPARLWRRTASGFSGTVRGGRMREEGIAQWGPA